jgi:hypothetical protein
MRGLGVRMALRWRVILLVCAVMALRLLLLLFLLFEGVRIYTKPVSWAFRLSFYL